MHLDSFQDAHAKNLVTHRSSELDMVNMSIHHPQLHLLYYLKDILASTFFAVSEKKIHIKL